MRLAVDALIRSLDYRTALFACAEDFLSSLDVDTCDCIISDVRMGGMSGIELVAELVARSVEKKPPPTILISAFTTRQMEDAARAAGAVCLLKKPFNAEVLIEHIEIAVGSDASGQQ
jgi:FixJ family two-component response regulator